MQNKTSLFLLLFICYSFIQAQTLDVPNYWTTSSDLQFRSSTYQREIIPEKYATYDLDIKAFQSQLNKSLPEVQTERRDQNVMIYLPNPSGKMELYTIWRSNLLPKKLNARYPEISVFAGYANEDPRKTVRLDFTSKGFRAVSYGLNQSTYYIDPIAKGVKNTVISYYKKDYFSQQSFECLVEDGIEVEKHHHDHGTQRMAGDCDMHTFELALACTGEYATFHGGTKPLVMAEYTTSINRINGLYENEIGVTFVFIPNTDELIFLDAATDPYTNNSGGAMLGENQTTCDNIIGSSNYDIGHVYSTGGGGVARLNSPCNNNTKAQGVTGLPSPVGDPFYVDYVAHEMGHQFGATHTYNNSCGGNRTASTAYEPGSGATIMAYAGICPPNVQFNSDAYFHSASLVQIGNFLSNTSCEDITNNSSDRPIIAPLQNYNIPISTPFELTTNAAVTDGSSLSYCWEQMDREIANMPPETTSGAGPMFRTYTPVASPSRVFPSFPFLLGNTDNEWEVLPGATRELNFRVTVRASSPGNAGCTEEADLKLNVTNSSGPFIVMAPNSNTFWTVGETQPVSWQVANTTAPPVNCDNVRILLSTDGGFTYPVTLLDNTPNDGEADIVVPNFPGNQIRIRVQAVDNVFFDISNENLTIIEPVVPTFTVSANPTNQSVCGSSAGTVSYELNSTSLAGFNSEVEYSVLGLPNGVDISFDNNSAIPNATTTLSLSGLDNLSTGTYTFSVEGNGGGESDEIELTLEVVDSAPLASQLLLPEDAAVDVNPTAILNWTSVNFVDGYTIEVSTEASFSNIVFTTSLNETNTVAENLNTATVYYWRVISTNICGNGPVSETYRFRTGSEACNTFTNETPVNIPAANAGSISSIINVPNGAAVQEVSLSAVILHSWIGDLEGKLISPQGDEVLLFDRPGIPDSDFGCARDNIRATFDDNASNTAADFEGTCGTGLYAIDDTYQPIEALSNLNNVNSTGDWTLEITDFVNEDGGSLSEWSLEICTNSGSSTPPQAVSNNPLTVIRSNSATITTTELSFSGNGNSDNINYTLFTLPGEGALMKNNVMMQIGDQFSQTEVDNNLISYDHSGTAPMTDSFIFDVEEIDGGWLPNNAFQINVIELDFTATATQTSAISCFEGEDGSISVSIDGGTAPYMYSLDGINFQPENIFNGLSAGEYTITVLDNDNNSVNTDAIILEQPDQLSIDAIVNENTVTVSATGGTGNYMYSYDNVNYQESNVFDNLQNGNYIFIVLDENNCIESTEQITILTNDLSATANIVTQVSCFNGNNGSISIMITGGMPPFTYALNNGIPQSSNFFENLSPGTYSADVMDSNGFSVLTNIVTLVNPDVLELTATVNGNQITTSATGGTGTYQYSLDGINYQDSNIFNGLPNGMYTVYVRDQNNCINNELVIIDVEQLSASGSISMPLNCNGDTNGSVTILASGGTPPYQYSLNNSFQTSNIFENLGAGNYDFVVLDAANSQTTVNIILTAPSALSLQVSSDSNIAILNAQGGTPPYSYIVDNSSPQTNPTFENLDEGQHTAIIIDALECTEEVTFNISINDLTASAFQVNEILCNGDQTGSITVNASNGTEPYTYSIDGINFQNENIFTDLGAGQYTITVRDGDEFVTSTNIVLDEPEALSLSASVSQNNITLIANGGTAPYEYNIDNGAYQSDAEFTSLATSSYTLNVRDANGCEMSVSATITFEELSGTINILQQIDCALATNGSLMALPIGGSAPYLYSLNGGPFTDITMYENLTAGQYSITIRDNDGMEFETNSVEIIEPNPIIAAVIQDGRNISINAIGGTGDLSYSINGDDFQTNNTFSNLSNGNYTAYVMDNNGCINETTFSINVDDLVAIASVSQAITCFGLSDGVIVVETSGGTNPKEFSIDGMNFQESNFFEGLSAGEYTITVRDADGLTTTTNTVTLNNPDPITATLDIMQNNVSVNAMGGTGILMYSIDGLDYQESNQFNQLENGEFTIYVSDANDCIYTNEFSIDFTALSASFDIEGENLCAGDMLVSITVSARDGVAPYMYSLDGGAFGQNNTFENLGAGVYNIVVMDASGSTFPIEDIEVTAPTALSLVSQVNNNMVAFEAQGGTSPYQYSIDGNDFQNSNEFENLPNGNLTGFVQDANGCRAETTFTINVINPLSINVTIQDFLDCNGLIAGSITANGMGGTPPYLYSLDEGPFEINNVFTNLPPGEYRITVQDAMMNEVSSLAILTAPNPLEMEVDIMDNDIEITVTGGAAPYIYSIDDGATFSSTSTFENLPIGDYIVIVEDANGCLIEQTITITSVSVSTVFHNLIIDLSPNPAKDISYLSLEKSSFDNINISLIDILGRTVRVYDNSALTGANKYALDISDILAGTYLVKVELDGQLAVRKLIVQ